MPPQQFNFTTGQSQLPDVGQCSYNGCTFSPLFATSVSGEPLKDEARRTVKYTKLTIEVDGYVTLPQDATSIAPTMAALHALLTAQGGALRYQGRGFDLSVNVANGVNNRDLAWGPVPELLEFQPLGGGLSAKVKWKAVVHISGRLAGEGFTAIWPKSIRLAIAFRSSNLLQFNFDTSVKYGEDRFSSITMSGTMEIPLTRNPVQIARNANDYRPALTVDDMRPVIESLVMRGIDKSRFRVTNSEFSMLRDKRTMTWSITAEEKPYMDLPPNCTVAKGTYHVKPARTGPGLCLWLCSLSATYTVRADVGRRQAWILFLALLRLRMSEVDNANIPPLPANQQQQQGQNNPPIAQQGAELALRYGLATLTFNASELYYLTRPTPAQQQAQHAANLRARRPMLLDFSISEGLYLDSKTVSFSATWRICTTFSHILVASGLWTKVRENQNDGTNLWATSMNSVNGATSWLQNRTDPASAIIVDFGS